jgi:hypothetical protein
VVNNTSPANSTSRSPLVGFAIRVCLWLLLLPYPMITYFSGPQIEQFLLHRGIDVPGGLVLAFRVSHFVNVYFIPLAILVLVDGVGTSVVAQSRAAQSVGRTWSRLMWAPPLFLHATILVGVLIGALEILAKVTLRQS